MGLPAYTAPVEFTNTWRELFEEAGVKFAVRNQRTNHKTHGTLTEEQVIVSRDGIEAGLLAITWRRFPDATEAQADYSVFCPQRKSSWVFCVRSANPRALFFQPSATVGY